MRQMRLGAFLRSFGHHVAAWRHPESPSDADVNFDFYLRLARIAERGLFDLLFIADNSSVPDQDHDILSRTAYVMRIDPIPLMSALAAVTREIGLVCTSTTTYNEPYLVARRFAALDHISGGRSGWNLVTSGNPAEAFNFGLSAHPDPADRYKRAREFAEVVVGLWDSWDEDAFVRDKESGVFFDPEKMHVLNHSGEHFRVRGPLNIARSPQGRPVMVQAGSSDDGRDLAAATAEVIFTAHPSLAGAQAFYSDLKERVQRYGRDPESVKIMPGIFATVGRTEDEAQRKYEDLQNLIDPAVGLNMLSAYMNFDLSGYAVDGPLPELPAALMAQGRPALLASMARRDNLTIRQLYMHMAGGRGHMQIVGSPTQVADLLEEWFTAGAADGFNIMPPVLPSALEDFVELVIPELQRRGLFRTHYEGRTLREKLGLPTPRRVSAASEQRG